MDRFNPEPNLVSGFSFLEMLQEASLAPASYASNSHMIRSGRSVQALGLPHCHQFSHQVISPAPDSSRALNDYSIQYLSSFEKILACPGLISQEDLDEIVPVDSTVKDLATTNWQQHTHTFSMEQSSLAVSGPLLDSAAVACPLAEYKQQPLQLEPVGFTPSQSPDVTAQKSLADSGKTFQQSSNFVAEKAENEDLPVKNEQSPPDDCVAIRTSEVCQRAYQRAYHKAYHRALRAELNLSGDIVKARLAARVAGKAAGKAERDRVKETLVCIPTELHTITPGEAYDRAYSRAYRAERNSSGDKVRARRAGRAAGQVAAKAERERVQDASASRQSPPPNPSAGYQKAYHKASWGEMVLSGDKDKARKAGQCAGKAATAAAQKAIEERAKQSASLAKPQWIPIRPRF